MRERGHRLGLAVETRERNGIGGKMRGQDLDRDESIELGIERPVYLAHAAGAERRDDFVRSETGSCGQRHVYVEQILVRNSTAKAVV